MKRNKMEIYVKKHMNKLEFIPVGWENGWCVRDRKFVYLIHASNVDYKSFFG